MFGFCMQVCLHFTSIDTYVYTYIYICDIIYTHIYIYIMTNLYGRYNYTVTTATFYF